MLQNCIDKHITYYTNLSYFQQNAQITYIEQLHSLDM